MRRRIFMLAFAMLVGLQANANAQAKKDGEPTTKPAAPSALRGNIIPHCEPGRYPAGNICKPAPPGFYAPASATYPVRCPEGKTSPSGSRSPSECR
jgi:hypothetical protein